MAMPSSVELNQAFGGKGSVSQTQDVAKSLIDEERSGRLMRSAQPQDNCRIGFNLVATFSSATGQGATVSDWLDFGTMRFLAEPCVTTGCMRLAQVGEPSLPADKTGYDPASFLTVPGDAMVLCYRTDDRGLINGAKVVLVALGSVPDGYQVQISVQFFGTAIRKG